MPVLIKLSIISISFLLSNGIHTHVNQFFVFHSLYCTIYIYISNNKLQYIRRNLKQIDELCTHVHQQLKKNSRLLKKIPLENIYAKIKVKNKNKLSK